ncbi:MAG TPA: hypothetical protein VE800_09445, partial [Actinomycetota bacterium]|nr:hypothetical protein [Actinomycetota bacterium]
MEQADDDQLAQQPDERLVEDVDVRQERRALDAHVRVRVQQRLEVDPPRFHGARGYAARPRSFRRSIIVRASRIAAPVGSLL